MKDMMRVFRSVSCLFYGVLFCFLLASSTSKYKLAEKARELAKIQRIIDVFGKR